MVLDHLNRYLWWHQGWIEQAARVVFPFFAIVLGAGLRRDEAGERAMRQIWVLSGWGVLAQLAVLPLVVGGVRDSALMNVLFTLAAGCALVGTWELPKVVRALCWVLALAAACLCEYGPFGALLVFFAWRGSWAGLAACVLYLAVSQLSFVPLAVPFFIWLVGLWCEREAPMRSPRRLFAAGYVAQWGLVSLLFAAGA